MSAGIDEAKQAIRRRVWDLLVAEHVVERGVHGYIPAFVGAEAAADRLAGLAGGAPLPWPRTGPAGASARRVPRRPAVRPG